MASRKRTLDEDIGIADIERHTGHHIAEEYASVTLTTESGEITPHDWDKNYRFESKKLEAMQKEVSEWNLLDTESKNILYSLSKGYDEPSADEQGNFLITVLINNYKRKYENSEIYESVRDWLTLMITMGVKKGFNKVSDFNSSQNSANTENLASAKSVLCRFLRLNDRIKIRKLNDSTDSSTSLAAASTIQDKKKIHPLHKTKLYTYYKFLLEIGQLMEYSVPMDFLPLTMMASIQKRPIRFKEPATPVMKTVLALNSRKLGIVTFDRGAVGKYSFDFIKSPTLNECVSGFLKQSALRYEISAGSKVDLSKDDILSDSATVQTMMAVRDRDPKKEKQQRLSTLLRFGGISEVLAFKEKDNYGTRCYTRIDFFVDPEIFLSESHCQKIIDSFEEEWLQKMEREIDEHMEAINS